MPAPRLTDAFGSLRPEDVPPAGMPEAREALAAFEGLAVDQVCLTCGATAALTAALTALRVRGDRDVLLCPRPHFPGYPGLAVLCGFRVSYYPAQGSGGARAWLAALRAAIWRQRPACVLLNSPHNPTGATVGSSAIRALATFARAQGCEVIVDESFAGIGPGTPPGRLGLVQGLVRVGGFNKRFPHMADLRLGYALAEPRRAADIALAHRTMSLGASVAAQRALCELLAADPVARLARLSAEIREHVRLAARLLATSPHLRPVRPRAGLFMLVRVPPHVDAAAFSHRLRASSGVWCAAAPSFGVDDAAWIRLRLGVPRPDLVRHCRAIVRLARRTFGAPAAPGGCQSVTAAGPALALQ